MRKARLAAFECYDESRDLSWRDLLESRRVPSVGKRGRYTG